MATTTTAEDGDARALAHRATSEIEIPAPAPGIPPLADVPDELLPYLRPLGGADEAFVRHNVTRGGRGWSNLTDAMHRHQLMRAQAAFEAAPRLAAAAAAHDIRCPACGERAVGSSLRNALCWRCQATDAAIFSDEAARDVLAEGVTRRERVAVYRKEHPWKERPA